MTEWVAEREDQCSAVRPRINARVRAVYREWWTRTLVLSGDVEAAIRYDGRGFGEAVYVDGVLRGHSYPLLWTMKIVAPQVKFTLPGKDRVVQALVEVGATLLPWRFGIYRFRLTVDDEMLYDEDTGDIWFAGGPGWVTDEPYEPDY
jgi:hypothetical protein